MWWKQRPPVRSSQRSSHVKLQNFQGYFDMNKVNAFLKINCGFTKKFIEGEGIWKWKEGQKPR